MRQKNALLVIATVVAAVCSLASTARAASWESDLEQARAIAQQQNKLLLIHFWTPDCGPCKVVEKKVFPAPEVDLAMRQNYVPLKINAFQNTVLRDYFQVRQWPTDVVATVDGKTIHKMVTPLDPHQYATTLTAVANSYRQQLRSPTSNSFLPPTASSTIAQPRDWSTQIAPPELTDNSARAIRPGIDMQPIPEPLGGPMVPNPNNSAVNPARPGYSQPTEPRALAPAAPPTTIANRFVNDRFAQHAPSYSTHSEIQNPYAAAAPTTPQRFLGPSSNVVVPSGQPAPYNPTPAHTQQVAGYYSQNQNTQPDNTRSATAPQHDEPSFGLDGRCPVTLVTKRKWVKGDERWGAVHRGMTYLFAGPQEQQVFMADPDQYSPVLAGMDVVALAADGQVVQGRRKFGVLYDDDGKGPRPNRIYLFDSASTRDRFETRPESYVQPVMQALRQDQLQTLVR